tara:strand:- start:308 stop:2260 length:1953 start_codon:yes stop_codon:yes gene_type:complete
MHVSGELFVNALIDSTPQDLRDFLNSGAKFIKKIELSATDRLASTYISGWHESISGRSGFRHAPSLRSDNSSNSSSFRFVELDELFPIDEGQENRSSHQFPAGFIIDTLWQAVRLCGLVHDIGHLPMSHSLEGALEIFAERSLNKRGTPASRTAMLDFINKSTSERVYRTVIEEFESVINAAYPKQEDRDHIRNSFSSFPVHEKRSLLILHDLQQVDPLQFTGDLKNYKRLIYRLAFIILLSSVNSDHAGGFLDEDGPAAAPPNSVDSTAFRFMKLIIAGSVDADRMDYTYRDGYSSGVDIGSFGVGKVISSATLFRDKKTKEFRIGFFHRALPEIEEFFAQRYIGYKHIIYHRTSSRAEVCLQHAIGRLLEFCALDQDDPISVHLSEEQFIAFNSDGALIAFPVYSGKIEERVDGTRHSANIPYLDDAKFRTSAEWVLRNIQQRMLTERSQEKREMLSKIQPLLRIPLRREFKHLYDPFKDGSVTRKARLALKNVTRGGGDYDKIRKIIATVQAVRTACIRDFLRTIEIRVPSDISVIISEQVPKVYDHTRAFRKGEEVYLTYNGVSADGVVPTRRIIDASPYLRNMSSVYVDEMRINCFFVRMGLKYDLSKDNSLRETLEAAIDEALSYALSRVDSAALAARKMEGER